MGIMGVHSACCAALDNIGIITNTSIENAGKRALLGGISEFINAL